jgi:hypothetical protein
MRFLSVIRFPLSASPLLVDVILAIDIVVIGLVIYGVPTEACGLLRVVSPTM